jgi:hypothetical protein
LALEAGVIKRKSAGGVSTFGVLAGDLVAWRVKPALGERAAGSTTTRLRKEARWSEERLRRKSSPIN